MVTVPARTKVASPEKERAAVLATLKEREAQLKSPETLKIWRTVLEAERGEKSSGAAAAFSAWEARYPAAFMVRGPGGDVLGFLSPGYTGMPWQLVHAIVAGKDAVDTGRAAAAARLEAT